MGWLLPITDNCPSDLYRVVLYQISLKSVKVCGCRWSFTSLSKVWISLRQFLWVFLVWKCFVNNSCTEFHEQLTIALFLFTCFICSAFKFYKFCPLRKHYSKMVCIFRSLLRASASLWAQAVRMSLMLKEKLHFCHVIFWWRWLDIIPWSKARDVLDISQFCDYKSHSKLHTQL